MKKYTIKEFNASNFKSPASNNIWNFENALEKFLDRSILEMVYKVDVEEKRCTHYGDSDHNVHLNAYTESQWSESPAVSIDVDIPLHITCNSNIEWDWGCNIDDEKIKADLKMYKGNLYINDDIEIEFTLDELTDLEIIKAIVFRIIERMKTKIFCEAVLSNFKDEN